MADNDNDTETGAAPEEFAAPDTTAAPSSAGEVFPQLDGPGIEPETTANGGKREEGRNIDAMLNVGLNVQVILGQSRMAISQLLELSRGSVVELNKKIGAPVDLVINDRLIARGDLVKVGEDRLGVTLTEIAKDYVANQ